MVGASGPGEGEYRERAGLLRLLTEIVEPLNRSLPGPSEVVVHDLSRLPNSIVAISGHLTGREVGGACDEVVLRDCEHEGPVTRIGYETGLPDGSTLRSSAIVIHDSRGEAVAVVCVNFDVSMWRTIHSVCLAMLPGVRWPGNESGNTADRPSVRDRFDHDIDELAAQVLQQAIGSVGVPVELMQKRHKVEVVRTLKVRGFFTLKDSVEDAAAALQVTRFTVYNYLNALEGPVPG